ncbi:mitochondrial enolase superfamily member 1-like [Ictidomys tridecemlineatus]
MALGRISRLSVRDVRFPTSLGATAQTPCIQTLTTWLPMLSWRLMWEMDSRDMELPSLWEKALKLDLKDIVSDFRGFYRQLTSDGQLRWIGPEKGVVHLATAAILNVVWDLWAKQEGKPLWKLLVDMDPRALLSCIDFRYITDVLTEEDAYEILKKGKIGKKERVRL